MGLEKFISRSGSQGLPNGANEIKYSVEGYKSTSPDRFNPYNIIPSGDITMQGVPHPVYGVDNLGNGQMMHPGMDYKFPGDEVTELPMAQVGREAIIVPPGDLRAQSYTDSLDLYNKSRRDIRYAKSLPETEVYDWFDTWHRAWHPKIKPTSWYDLLPKERNYFPNPGESRGAAEYGDRIHEDEYKGWIGLAGVSMPKYKKPSQPYFEEGSKKAEIVKKQQELKEAGLYKGKIDGIWGSKSQAAWEEYQSKEPVKEEINQEQQTQKSEPVDTPTKTQTKKKSTVEVPAWKQVWISDDTRPGGGYWKKVYSPTYKDVSPPEYQKGGRTPIYVDSLDDPRYKAYQDSLINYNLAKQSWPGFTGAGYDESRDKGWYALNDEGIDAARTYGLPNPEVGFMGTFGMDDDVRYPVYKPPVHSVQLNPNKFEYVRGDETVASDGSVLVRASRYKSKRTKPDPKRSVVDNLNLMGEDSSFANRKKLAEQAGITNYKGTAEQNDILNKWLSNGRNVEQKQPVEEETTQEELELKSENVNTPASTKKKGVIEVPSWKQVWVDDPNSPVGGYWKKVYVGHEQDVSPPEYQGGNEYTVPPASEYLRLYGHAKDYDVGQETVPQGGDMHIDPETGRGYFLPGPGSNMEEAGVPKHLWNLSRFSFQPIVGAEPQYVHSATYNPITGEMIAHDELRPDADPYSRKTMRQGLPMAKRDLHNYYTQDLGLSEKEAKPLLREDMQDLRAMKRAQNKMGNWNFKSFQTPQIFDERTRGWQNKYSPWSEESRGTMWDPNVKFDMSDSQLKRAYTKFQKAWRDTPGKEARQNSKEEIRKAKERDAETIKAISEDLGITPKEFKKNYKDYKMYTEESFDAWKDRVTKRKNGGKVDPEMMNKDKYNTSLTPQEKVEYDKWVKEESKKQGRDILMDQGAYDIQGFWKSGAYKDVDAQGHGTDLYKKPNHPTFSTQSMYASDQYPGGIWMDDGSYYAPASHKELYSPDYYNWMFGQEADVRPEHFSGYMASPVTVIPNMQQGGTPNEILTYKDNPEWFDNRAVFWQGNDPKGQYNDMIRQKIYSGKYGYNPTTGAIIPLEADQYATIPQSTKDALRASEKLIAERRKVRAMSPEDQREYQYNKFKHSMYEQGRYPVVVDEIGGNYNEWDPKIYQEGYTPKPWEGKAGQTVWLTDEEERAYDKEWSAKSMQEMGRNPLFYAPGMVGMMGAPGGAALGVYVGAGSSLGNLGLGNYEMAALDAGLTALPFAGQLRVLQNLKNTKLLQALKSLPFEEQIAKLSQFDDVATSEQKLANMFKNAGDDVLIPTRTEKSVMPKFKNLERDLGIDRSLFQELAERPTGLGLPWFFEKAGIIKNPEAQAALMNNMRKRLAQFPGMNKLMDGNTTYWLGKKYGVDWDKFYKNYKLETDGFVTPTELNNSGVNRMNYTIDKDGTVIFGGDAQTGTPNKLPYNANLSSDQLKYGTVPEDYYKAFKSNAGTGQRIEELIKADMQKSNLSHKELLKKFIKENPPRLSKLRKPEVLIDDNVAAKLAGFTDKETADFLFKNPNIAAELTNNPEARELIWQKKTTPPEGYTAPNKFKDLNKDNVYYSVGERLKGNKGQNNQGIFKLKDYPGKVVKFENPKQVSRLMGFDDYANYSLDEIMENLPDNLPIAKIHHQIDISPTKRAFIMDELSAIPEENFRTNQLSNVVSDESIKELYNTLKQLRNNDVAFDYVGVNNLGYNPELDKFVIYDLNPTKNITKNPNAQYWANNVLRNTFKEAYPGASLKGQLKYSGEAIKKELAEFLDRSMSKYPDEMYERVSKLLQNMSPYKRGGAIQQLMSYNNFWDKLQMGGVARTPQQLEEARKRYNEVYNPQTIAWNRWVNANPPGSPGNPGTGITSGDWMRKVGFGEYFTGGDPKRARPTTDTSQMVRGRQDGGEEEVNPYVMTNSGFVAEQNAIPSWAYTSPEAFRMGVPANWQNTFQTRPGRFTSFPPNVSEDVFNAFVQKQEQQFQQEQNQLQTQRGGGQPWKYQGGGQSDYYEVELTDNEIAELRRGGYVVEEM